MKNKIGKNKFYIVGIVLALLIISVSLASAVWPFTGNVQRNNGPTVTLGKRFVVTGEPNTGADVPAMVFDKRTYNIVEFGRDHISISGCSGSNRQLDMPIGVIQSCGPYTVLLQSLATTNRVTPSARTTIYNNHDVNYVAVVIFTKSGRLNEGIQLWADDSFTMYVNS